MKYQLISHIRLLIFSIAILTLGMGFGRFLYTALFPLMLIEGTYDFHQLSYIASANYIGYLVGALLFSFSIFHRPSSMKLFLLCSLIATTVFLFLMYFQLGFLMVFLIRFLAGMASAGAIIFGSTTILMFTQNRVIISTFFAGVGFGILLGNELVNIGSFFNIPTFSLWLCASGIALVITLMAVLYYPRENQKILTYKSISQKTEIIVPWFTLVVLYGLSGFGYIITATYLPIIAHGLENRVIAEHLWSLVGIGAILSCYLWIYIEKQVGVLLALISNLLSQSVFVFLSCFSASPVLLIISALGFGMTFMGTTSLVMTLARKTDSPKFINLLGLVTFAYGIGQIFGPILTSFIQNKTGGITLATLLGGISLFTAALITILYLIKKGDNQWQRK